MKHQPVRTYKTPEYPKKEYFIFHPELLLKNAPPKWLRNSLAAGSLFAFVSSGFLQIGCKNTGENRESASGENNAGLKKTKEVKQEQVKIAPLFIHGDGVGATGCVITTPPVFLSEAEAFDIIYSALKKENIEFDQRDWLLEGVCTEEKSENFDRDRSEHPDSNPEIRHPFFFDAYNSKLNLGIKFISINNYFALGGVQSLSSVTSYDTVKVAQEVKEILQDYQIANAAIFYDPVIVSRESLSYMDIPEADRAEARRLLTQQVSDFVIWFKNNMEPKKSTP